MSVNAELGFDRFPPLCADSHDAELDTLARFERAVQQGDEPSWAMAEGRKKAVLARLNVGKESPMEGLFKGGKLPTK